MNGSLNRKLHGILALAAALLLANAGCVGAPGESADVDEDVSAAVQQLDAVDSDGAGDDADDGNVDDEAGAAVSEGGVLPAGDDPHDAAADPGGPDPLPWHGLLMPPADDPEAADPTPMTHTSSSTPSTGNGGK